MRFPLCSVLPSVGGGTHEKLQRLRESLMPQTKSSHGRETATPEVGLQSVRPKGMSHEWTRSRSQLGKKWTATVSEAASKGRGAAVLSCPSAGT